MRFETSEGSKEFAIRDVIVAGWTGRDRASVDHHIEELAAIGVAPPSKVPLYYRVSDALLTSSEDIQVLGPNTSGEVEPLIVCAGGETWLGLASDHTDRALEVVSVAASKQICAKPVAAALWRFTDVEDRLDQLILTCDIRENDEWIRYQEGALATIRPLPDLIKGAELIDGAAMLCGTLPALGGVRSAPNYRMALVDPVLDRSIRLAYSVETLPLVS